MLLFSEMSNLIGWVILDTGLLQKNLFNVILSVYFVTHLVFHQKEIIYQFSILMNLGADCGIYRFVVFLHMI